ncbi:MAG: phospholipase D-like domain-containing protein [Kofleriaceae bacterium]
MSPWLALVTHHAVGLFTFVVTIALSSKVLQARRPVGSSTAWVLAFVLLPYVSIPLFLFLGDRKLSSAKAKPELVLSRPTGHLVTQVEWLETPELAYERLCHEIRSATRSIHISTFVLGNDATGTSVLELLTARARAGVEVRLLLDGLWKPRAPSTSELREAGGQVAVFLPLIHLPLRGRSNSRDHRKLAIFDGAIAIVGGMNIADEYMGPPSEHVRWRDLSIRLTGPSAANLARIFRADWAFAKGAPIAEQTFEEGATDIEIIPTGPDCAGDAWHDALLQLVFSAKRRLEIATPYFAPDESLLEALQIAARRGVEVNVIVPAKSNHWFSDRVGGQLLREIAAAGVHVFRYTPSMLHAKALLVDDDVAAVGSANFNARSLFLDFEVTAVLRGPTHNAAMAMWFEQTRAHCDAGPPIARGLKRPVEAVARLFSPLT